MMVGMKCEAATPKPKQDFKRHRNKRHKSNNHARTLLVQTNRRCGVCLVGDKGDKDGEKKDSNGACRVQPPCPQSSCSSTISCVAPILAPYMTATSPYPGPDRTRDELSVG